MFFSIGVPCQTIGFEPIDEIWLIYLIATITIICNPEITATDQSYVVRLARVEECGIPARRTGAITRTIACDSIGLRERGLVSSAAPTVRHNFAVAFVFHQNRDHVVERPARCPYATRGRDIRLNYGGSRY